MDDETRESPRVRLGVLGCADIAWRRTLPAARGIPEIRLVAVASREPAKAQRFAAEFGADAVDRYEDLLDRADIDAVYIPLPTGLHHRWISAALHAGKHVLAEKPLTGTYAETEELVKIAASRGLVLMENFAFLCHRRHAAVRDLVADGAIGELRVFEGRFGFPPRPVTDFRYRPDLGGGALLDAGVYPVRAALSFLGPELEVAGAVLKDDPAYGVDVAGTALLCTPRGETAQIAFGFEHSYRCDYSLWGSVGRIVVDRAYTPPPGWETTVRLEQQGRVQELTVAPDDQFAGQLTAFTQAVLDPGPPPATDDILTQARLIEAIRDRARHTGGR